MSTASATKTLPADIQSRLEHLRTLKDGWYDDGYNGRIGSAIPEVTIQFCEKLLQQLPPELLTKVMIVPDPDGGINLNWNINTYDWIECCIFKDPTEDDSWVWIHNHNQSISKEFKFEQLSECSQALIDLHNSMKNN